MCETDDCYSLPKPERKKMRMIIKSWTPEVLKLEIRANNSRLVIPEERIDPMEARERMEEIRPSSYDQQIMIKFENNIAYGEIDMCIWTIESQMSIIKELETHGWKWS